MNSNYIRLILITIFIFSLALLVRYYQACQEKAAIILPALWYANICFNLNSFKSKMLYNIIYGPISDPEDDKEMRDICRELMPICLGSYMLFCSFEETWPTNLIIAALGSGCLVYILWYSLAQKVFSLKNISIVLLNTSVMLSLIILCRK